MKRWIILNPKYPINEVNNVLSVIHEKLGTKLIVDEFQTAKNHQNIINNIFYKGKWLSNKSTVKKGYIVPYERECFNISWECCVGKRKNLLMWKEYI